MVEGGSRGQGEELRVTTLVPDLRTGGQVNQGQHYSNRSDIEKIYLGGKLAFLFNLIGQMQAFFGERGRKSNVFLQNINRWFCIKKFQQSSKLGKL